jgi:bacterioferritin-associated ferredoxin
VLVCHCEVVNDRRILEEVLEGAADPDAVAARCGAGSRCGGCRPTIEALLASLGLAGQPVA